ncbi:2675_t:CDS:2, partial [Ambispora gerdemannii]
TSGVLRFEKTRVELILETSEQEVAQEKQENQQKGVKVRLKAPGEPRPWWSPDKADDDPDWNNRIATHDGENNVKTYVKVKGRAAGYIRDIVKNGTLARLHPHFFTKEQFKELKQLLPDNRVCKEPHCYNNHIFQRGSGKHWATVENGVCNYHRAKREGKFAEYDREEVKPYDNPLGPNFDDFPVSIQELIEKIFND